MKPWGKYEIDYLDHPKFRALHGNAFFLWWEVKNYCDKWLTDGRFPATMVRTFRHYAEKAIEQLTRSCGIKPNGDAYAPLWESQDIGGVAYFVMHDYLLHNDCREVVLARVAKADEEAKRRADNQKEYRERKRRERDGNVTGNANGNAEVTRDQRYQRVTPKQLQQQKQLHKEQQKSGGGGKPRPQFQNHRFAVHRWQVDELISMLGPHIDTFDLDEWLMTGAARKADVDRVAVEGDWWAWLKAETIREAKRRGCVFTKPGEKSQLDHEAERKAHADEVLRLLEQDRRERSA